MMRIDCWMLATAPVDMRMGMDSLLARVVAVFGAAQPHTAYAFANLRANRMKVLLHDGFGLWLCTRRLHQGSPVLAQWRATPDQPQCPTMAGPHRGLALAQTGGQRWALP
jgi:transposase